MEVMSGQPEKLWKEGANQAADAIIVRSNMAVCMIRRRDGGGLALPGGFVNDGETTLEAARREAFEETGLSVNETAGLVYSGRVNDPRNSSTRWIESDAYVFEVDEGTPVAGDDAESATWVPLSSIPSLNNLYGSHKEMVMRYLDRGAQQWLNDMRENAESLPTKGGHMAYDYELLKSEYGHVFLKTHNPANYTIPEKEERGRYYLKREASMLQHLRQSEYHHIPNKHQLFAQQTLVIEGLPESEGWHWQLPEDFAYREHYIEHILHSLHKLDAVPLPYEDGVIQPSLVSFHEEGWDALDDLTAVAERIRSFQQRLKPETVTTSEKLIAALASLKASFSTVEPEPDVFSHHDARQSNIAWHPERGVKIVDWSWAGPGIKKADSTMFLIDIAKSGHDVTPYIKEHFSPEYAQLLIGFWLGHSLLPTRSADDTVRLHQIASAVTAYELLDL